MANRLTDEMLEAIQLSAKTAAAEAVTLALEEIRKEMYDLHNLDERHPDFIEHRIQHKDRQTYLKRQFEGQKKVKTWFLRGIFTGVGTFIFTAIWKGWDNLVSLFSQGN